jgi:hypothetical protein
MNIRKRYLIDNMLVGLIPIFLIFTIFFFLNRQQARENVRNALANYIRNFKIEHAADMTKFQDYSYFITRMQVESFRQDNPRNLRYPVSVGGLNFRLFEVYRDGEFTSGTLKPWQDSKYFMNDETAEKIWNILSRRNTPSITKCPTPRTYPTRNVRSCSILVDPVTARKPIRVRIDASGRRLFCAIPLQSEDVIYYIQNTNGFIFSKTDFEITILRNPERDQNRSEPGLRDHRRTRRRKILLL